GGPGGGCGPSAGRCPGPRTSSRRSSPWRRGTPRRRGIRGGPSRSPCRSSRRTPRGRPAGGGPRSGPSSAAHSPARTPSDFGGQCLGGGINLWTAGPGPLLLRVAVVVHGARLALRAAGLADLPPEHDHRQVPHLPVLLRDVPPEVLVDLVVVLPGREVPPAHEAGDVRVHRHRVPPSDEAEPHVRGLRPDPRELQE